jgi:hypothetical protein
VFASAVYNGRVTAPAIDAARKLQLALDLQQLGIDMQLERIRRERPGISDSAARALLRRWIRSQPLPDLSATTT